ncbi:BLUF domain-containing protein [Roseobacter sp. S98]|uniref:BLUF domain-containing protein n=1 Tax=Roseobacter algicola (ex Choi et al. 2025) (nom. illeg.) TaxID=3092138 RepID=UPI0035C69B50
MQPGFLLYASRLDAPMGFRALNALLDVSQKNNRRDDITGFLHIEDQIVLQYLEGPTFQLGVTVDRIRHDPRHSGFTILSHGNAERRCFDGWNMALVECTTMAIADLMGRHCTRITELAAENPADLIGLLSANASLLNDRYRVA